MCCSTCSRQASLTRPRISCIAISAIFWAGGLDAQKRKPRLTPVLELPTVAILGAGSMGRAVLSGLLSPDVTVSGGIRTTNRSVQKAAALAGLSDVTALATESTPEANVRAVTGAGLVVLAVK